MKTSTNPRAGYRFPAEIFGYAVWLNSCFALNFRDIEELPAAAALSSPERAFVQWGEVTSVQYAG